MTRVDREYPGPKVNDGPPPPFRHPESGGGKVTPPTGNTPNTTPKFPGN
jgi:hypothetical protein